MKTMGLPATLRNEFALPFDLTTPSVARTKLATFLTRHQVAGSVLDDALIVLSEMISNAVSHGDPTRDGILFVAWEIDHEVLHLHVVDGGVKKELHAAEFDTDSLNGRGLAIISTLSRRWWVDDEPHTSVHAEIAI